MIVNWLKKPKTQNHIENIIENPSEKHADVIDFMYRILFSRNAETTAISHWSKFLEEGLTYKELFEMLWRSEEFSTKVEQNPYFKKPTQENVALTQEHSDSLINDEMLNSIFAKLSQERNLLLQIDAIRSLVSQWRYRDLRGADNVKYYDATPGSGIIDNTIAHNEAAIRSYVGIHRGDMVITPLKSITKIKASMSSLKVLSIGARTEMELFSLIAAGFDPKNITIVDLISYSPYIELGDMHHLKYEDNSFDVVVVSTVFLCSNDKPKAAREIIRVIKPGGVVAFGDKRDPDYLNLTPAEVEVNRQHLNNCEEILNLFAPHVSTIYFKTEPQPPFNDEITASMVVIFEIDKP